MLWLLFLLLMCFAQLESAAEANRILLESNKPNKTRRKKRAASAGKSPNVRRTPVRKRHPTNARPASEHYRLNLAEIPFINGRVGLVQVQCSFKCSQPWRSPGQHAYLLRTCC